MLHIVKHYLIYVPGLGDRKIRGQQAIVNIWPIWGVKSEVYHMKWYDGEGFDPKMNSLGSRIRELKSEGYTVSLVGSSAGGAAVVNAFAGFKDDLHAMVSIAGALYGKDIVHPYTYRSNPAFKEAMFENEVSIATYSTDDLSRIYTAAPLIDAIVNPKNTRIKGAKNVRLPALGHVIGIAFGISFFTPVYIRFIKHLPPKV